MGIVKSATLTAIRKQFVVLFNEAMRSAPSQWMRVATRVPSTSAENVYGWLGKFPQLREWTGDRLLQKMAEYAYTLVNKKFETTVDVDRADIEDDNIGMYRPLIEHAGLEAMNHIDAGVFGQLKDGFTSLCYDGQNYFDTDHPVYPNTDKTGAVTPTSNIVNPLVTNKPPWHLLCTKLPLKPLIFQDRVAAEIEMITDTQQETVFMKDKYLYGVRARRAFGVGLWRMGVGCRDTLNEENLNAAIKTMMEFKADGGRPLGIIPDLLVVPPALRAAANEAVEVMLKAGGASNPNYKAVDVLVTPWLA